MLILRLLTLFMTLSLSSISWAQSACSRDFTKIEPPCIEQVGGKYDSKPITLSSELKGNVYFYKTATGDLGKFRVLSVKVSPVECTLFIDGSTFGGESVFTPNSSISISVGNNHWLKSRIFLDRDGSSALELVRSETKKACAFRLSEGSSLRLFKKFQDEKLREENYLLLYGPLVLVFIAIFIIVKMFLDEQNKFKTQEALEEAEASSKSKNQPLFIKLTKPFYKRYFLPLVQGSKNKVKIRNKYRQKLANAGLLKELTPEDFLALKIFMIIGGPLVFLLVRWITEESWPLEITPVMALIGYFYPDVWLSGQISNRNTLILRAMPFIVDMLALSVEAGLDFMAAIQRVIEKAPPSPLVDEFETLIKETRIGSTRAEGLRQMSWRINLMEINSFCATLIAADSVGASIAPLLKQQSNELRMKRSSKAEQLGAQAATKILIPMIFFILPAVLVAIFAPMALKMITTGDM